MSATGFLDNVNRSFDRAAAFSGLDKGLLDEIKAVNSLYRFAPIVYDVGSVAQPLQLCKRDLLVHPIISHQ